MSIEVEFQSLWRGTIIVLPPKPPTMADIVREVAEENGISVSDILGASRERRFVWPRQEAMWRCRQTGKSYPQIARYFGGRDHTTSIWACRAHEKRMRENA